MTSILKNVYVDNSPAIIYLDEDVLKTSFVFVFRRRLDEGEYISSSHTSSEDLLNVSSRRLD